MSLEGGGKQKPPEECGDLKKVKGDFGTVSEAYFGKGTRRKAERRKKTYR